MLLMCCTHYARFNMGFPDSSVGTQSACDAGDPGLIPRLGRSAGEGIGYPLQCSGLENSMNCYSSGGCKESDMTEQPLEYASKFGKLSNGHGTGKSQFPFQSQRKTIPKKVQTTTQLHSSHMLAK